MSNTNAENKTDKAVSSKRTIHVANAVTINPRNPIPAQLGSDSFSYSAFGKKYIPFLGNDDNFANTLLESRLSSATHNACITSIADSVIGKGLIVKDQENPDKDFINWVANINNRNQSLNEALRGAIDGERSQGNQFIELVRGKVGSVRFLKVYLHSMLYCRLGPINKNTNYPDHVLISRSFAKKGYIPEQKDKVEIPLFDLNDPGNKKNWKKDGAVERTMLHFKNEVSGVDYYGLPASISSLRYQILEAKAAQYNIDMFENNLVISGALVFKSAMTQEEALANAQSILNSHTGDGKQGRISVLSSENGIEDFKFIPYETQKEGSYKELDQQMQKKIIGANGWAPEFLGDESDALGKGSGFLRARWDQVEAMTLKPLRRKLIDKVVAPIIAVWADWMQKPDVKKYQFDFNSPMPFSFLGDLKPEDFMKLNEARKLAGEKEDDSKKDVYIFENKKSAKNVSSE